MYDIYTYTGRVCVYVYISVYIHSYNFKIIIGIFIHSPPWRLSQVQYSMLTRLLEPYMLTVVLCFLSNAFLLHVQKDFRLLFIYWKVTKVDCSRVIVVY